MPLTDEDYMGMALRLARRGLGRTWPNPSVGAVVVRPGKSAEIVGRGWTLPGGRPHAEKVAIDAAGEAARGATLYVTLEPCCHKGRGAACTDVIAEAGISRVVCGVGDPDARMAGEGFEALRQAGVEVTTGVLEGEARLVALGHILRVMRNRPLVTLKVAVGSDGLVSRGDGGPVWVTGEESRRMAHLMRARNDAIVVGRGTVMADDPELTCRLPGMQDRSPVRVVGDSRLAMPDTSRLVNTARTVPLWIICTTAAPQKREQELVRAGARIIRIPAGELDATAAAGALAESGITRVLVEGGPTVLGSFLDAGLADRVAIFEGGKPAGTTGLKPFGGAGLDRVTNSRDFMSVSVRSLGTDRLTLWQRKGPA